MTCDEIQTRVAAAPLGVVDPDVRIHLARCESCRAYIGNDRCVRRLLGLKRYEKPDPFAEGRVAACVRDGLAGEVPGRAWLPDALRDVLAPALRWAAAAVAAVAVMSLLYPGDETEPPGPILAVPPAEEFQYVGRLDADHRPSVLTSDAPFAAAVTTNPALPVLRLKASAGDYRGGGLVPVSFEY